MSTTSATANDKYDSSTGEEISDQGTSFSNVASQKALRLPNIITAPATNLNILQAGYSTTPESVDDSTNTPRAHLCNSTSVPQEAPRQPPTPESRLNSGGLGKSTTPSQGDQSTHTEPQSHPNSRNSKKLMSAPLTHRRLPSGKSSTSQASPIDENDMIPDAGQNGKSEKYPKGNLRISNSENSINNLWLPHNVTVGVGSNRPPKKAQTPSAKSNRQISNISGVHRQAKSATDAGMNMISTIDEVGVNCTGRPRSARASKNNSPRHRKANSNNGSTTTANNRNQEVRNQPVPSPLASTPVLTPTPEAVSSQTPTTPTAPVSPTAPANPPVEPVDPPVSKFRPHTVIVAMGSLVVCLVIVVQFIH